MKKLFFPLALLLAACTGDGALSVQNAAQQNAALAIRQEANPAWQYESLRLYPVTGSASLQAQTSSYENMKLLSEAMKIPGFRVMEQKQFGRSESQWFHGVTVQNKTQDTVLLLSGDVVKGGNQDRVIAHHEVILPRSVRNIEVFCVEAGRSTYYNPQASAAEKEVAAFSGYFSVASPKVRRAVQNPGQQQAVWDAVANVTKANAAESSTSAYTTLDNESEQKKRRDAYITHLGAAFAGDPNVVGVIAVCGDRVLGADVFSNNDLFRRAYPALLHGYVAEAAVEPVTTSQNTAIAQASFERLLKFTMAQPAADDNIGKFSWNDQWLHLYGK
jgi:hypothetical protein